MHTIALISQKGGTGKTTIAVHLATAFTQAGKNVLVLDLDPQASAAEWHDAREAKFPHVESIQPVRLAKTAESAREIGTDVLILDTAPHSEATSVEAARLADLILIPCQPSIMDIRAIGKTIQLMKLVQTPAFAIINAVQHHSIGAARQAEKTIESVLGLPVAPCRLGERVAYNRCLITGHAAQEIEPEGKAANEIHRLWKWADAQLTKSSRKAA